MKTIFKKIIDRELPAEIVFENERIIAIKDKYPITPVHILLMPKKEIESMQKIKKEDMYLIIEIMEIAQQLAQKHGIKDGYRLLTNIGSDAGQSVYHLHFHLIGGRQLGVIG